MSRFFLPQRDKLEERETPSDKMIAMLNRQLAMTGKLYLTFGLDVNASKPPEDKPGRTPNVFLLKDGKPGSLAENNITPGSRDFWIAAMQGKLFGYPMGEKNPVQIQAWMGVVGLDFDYSKPLEPGKEPEFPEIPTPPKPMKQPVKPVKDYEEKDIKKPDPVDRPGEEPQKPSLWTRFIAFFGSKTGKARIADYREKHAAWVEQGVKYEEFQNKKQEYEDYQDAKEAYSGAIRRYDNSVILYQHNSAEIRARNEIYEIENKAWAAANEHRDELIRAREKSAQVIADAYGAQRGEAVLKTEQDEKAVAENLFSATKSEAQAKAGFEGGMSLYAPKPYVKESWIESFRYASTDLADLSVIDVDGLTVGKDQPVQVSDEEFSALAMFATVTVENGIKLAKTSSPPITDIEAAAKAFEELGFNREEFNDLMANQFTSVLNTEMMRYDSPRNPVSLYTGEFIEPARQNAKAALEEYRKGNKEPLAKIISRGIETSDITARISKNMNDTTQAIVQMAGHLVHLMERDPELRKLAAEDYEKRENAISARHKDLPAPRTMDTLIGNMKGYAAYRALQRESGEANAKLIKAKAGLLELSDRETKDALRAVMKYSVLETSHYSQKKTVGDEAMDKLKDIGEIMNEKYAGHETLSALSVTATTILHPHYAELAPRGKTPVLDSLRDPTFMNALDKHLDELIERDVQAAKGNPDVLRDKVLGGDKAYTGESLLNTLAAPQQPAATGKQGQPEAVKQQPEAVKQQPEAVKQQPENSDPEAGR